MISADVFRDQPTLTGPRVRLEPMGPQHFDGLWPMTSDPEGRRLTGTQQEFTEADIRRWLATRADQHDRADWVIVRRDDDQVLGEVVLNDLDERNASIAFRISLTGPAVFGHGYGTEATRLVVDHAFDVGLHRIHLEVFDFNPRAQRVYEKCGFVREGVLRDALYWDGEWHDAIAMAILSTDPRQPSPAS
ncbi:GNAT family protein [Amycolatopsis sp. NEAU-NG30]|uniref:GNAT family protein n=1 Tax=Amycolatopsis melonis TaxID=3156488 RepID=A0ABV0LNK2_9PSEU